MLNESKVGVVAPGAPTRFLPPTRAAAASSSTAIRPICKSTRSSTRRYRFDYSEQDHIVLLELLKGLPCQVMVSGY